MCGSEQGGSAQRGSAQGSTAQSGSEQDVFGGGRIRSTEGARESRRETRGDPGGIPEEREDSG